MSELKPIADEVCADCGKPLDILPGETFRADTTGRVWHYGCGRGRASPTPTNDGEGLIERVTRHDVEYLLSCLDMCDEAGAPPCELDPEDTATIAEIRAALNQGAGQ